MEKKTLSDIINNNFFAIPDYQRGYSWGDDQLDDLWRDLSWMRSEKNHYTGSLTIKNSPPGLYFDKKTSYGVLEVVDGQQRLTTLFLLVFAILREFKNKDGKRILGRRLDQVFDDFIEREIDENKMLCIIYQDEDQNNFIKKLIYKKIETCDELNCYARNLIDADAYFRLKLKKRSLLDLEILFEKVTKRMYFNVINVDDEYDVCSMFESINFRGKPLTNFEVLKNRLIYLCELIGRGDDAGAKAKISRANITLTWGYVYKKLGSGVELLDEDEFLRVHCDVYFGATKRYADFLLKNYFSVKKVVNEKENIEFLETIDLYVKSLFVAVDFWVYQRGVSYEMERAWWSSREMSDTLDRLNCLGIGHFESMVLGALVRIGLKDKDELKSPSAYIGNLLNLFKLIERFTFINYKLVVARVNHRAKRLFSSHGNLFYKDEKLFSDAIKEITKISNEEFGVSSDCKRLHLKIADKSKARFLDGGGWADWGSIKYVMLNYYLNNEIITSNKRFSCIFNEVNCAEVLGSEISWCENHKFLKKDIGNIFLRGEFVNIDEVEISDISDLNNRSIDLIRFMFFYWSIPRVDDIDVSEINLMEFTSNSIGSTDVKRVFSADDSDSDFDWNE